MAELPFVIELRDRNPPIVDAWMKLDFGAA